MTINFSPQLHFSTPAPGQDSKNTVYKQPEPKKKQVTQPEMMRTMSDFDSKNMDPTDVRGTESGAYDGLDF